MSLAANLNWSSQQLDVKNTFPNGELEEVYMALYPDFERRFGSEKMCSLKESLYGLKQSPRARFDKSAKSIRSHGYSQSQADPTLFYNHNG